MHDMYELQGARKKKCRRPYFLFGKFGNTGPFRTIKMLFKSIFFSLSNKSPFVPKE